MDIYNFYFSFCLNYFSTSSCRRAHVYRCILFRILPF